MKHLNSLNTLYYCHRQSALFRRVNFWSEDQLTKKKDLILIKDLISNKWKFKQKKQGWFHSQEYVYISTNISEGTAFLLEGLTYNEEVKLRRYNLKIKE